MEPPDLLKYNYLKVPEQDTWGVLMRKDCPLAENIMATFNLSGNAAVFAREGLGVVLTFDKLIEVSGDSDLCFRKIIPALHTKMYVIWKKYQVFTPVAELLLSK